MRKWCDVKLRGMLGRDESDDKEVVFLGRTLRVIEEGFEYEADPKHRHIVLDHFGLEKGSQGLSLNWDKEEKE